MTTENLFTIIVTPGQQFSKVINTKWSVDWCFGVEAPNYTYIMSKIHLFGQSSSICLFCTRLLNYLLKQLITPLKAVCKGSTKLPHVYRDYAIFKTTSTYSPQCVPGFSNPNQKVHGLFHFYIAFRCKTDQNQLKKTSVIRFPK